MSETLSRTRKRLFFILGLAAFAVSAVACSALIMGNIILVQFQNSQNDFANIQNLISNISGTSTNEATISLIYTELSSNVLNSAQLSLNHSQAVLNTVLVLAGATTLLVSVLGWSIEHSIQSAIDSGESAEKSAESAEKSAESTKRAVGISKKAANYAQKTRNELVNYNNEAKKHEARLSVLIRIHHHSVQLQIESKRFMAIKSIQNVIGLPATDSAQKVICVNLLSTALDKDEESDKAIWDILEELLKDKDEDVQIAARKILDDFPRK